MQEKLHLMFSLARKTIDRINDWNYTFHAVGVVLVNRCGGFAFSVEVTSSFCGAVLKATAPIGEVTVFSTGGNTVDRMETAYGSPARNIASLNVVLDGTC